GIGMVVALVTARRLADPLRHVADRAARLGAGDFRADPKRHGVPELDRVADALDASGTALSQLVQRERELVGDVSHQLRSRLTALQLRLEALAQSDDSEVSEEASAALDQAERLGGVLDDLLAAATAARARDAEPVDISELLSDVAGEWREPLRAEGRTLRQRVAPGLLARATPARLREAIGGLLDNALRHGKGTVTLAARGGVGRCWGAASPGAGGPGSGWRWPGPWWKPTAADWSWARRARRSSRYTCRWPGPMTCWACRGGANRPRGELAVRAQRRTSCRWRGTAVRAGDCGCRWGKTHFRNAHQRKSMPTSRPTTWPAVKSAISSTSRLVWGTCSSST